MGKVQKKKQKQKQKNKTKKKTKQKNKGFPKEEGWKEGWRKKRMQHAHGGQDSNLGPTVCWVSPQLHTTVIV